MGLQPLRPAAHHGEESAQGRASPPLYGLSSALASQPSDLKAVCCGKDSI
jgi:hypothetical protein